jgi:hypothetical protein
MVDDDRIPVPRHLPAQRTTERWGAVLRRDIREGTKQATLCSTSTEFSTAFARHDHPFDAVDLGSSGPLAGTAHCQDREAHASAAKAGQKMKAVRQISSVG